jgi:hypothetical protein
MIPAVKGLQATYYEISGLLTELGLPLVTINRHDIKLKKPLEHFWQTF